MSLSPQGRGQGEGRDRTGETRMPIATIDGLEVSYETRGTGPALLMLAPGGFDATMEKWKTAGVWKGMQPLDALAGTFQMIAYDRRESGSSGGRVERLSWASLPSRASSSSTTWRSRRPSCSAAAWDARWPRLSPRAIPRRHALILHWPVGGYRWKMNAGDRFARHLRFARDNGLAGVVKRAHEGKSFWQDPEAGPWASVIVSDTAFADAFQAQDLDRYLGIVAASGHTLFDRETPPGADPEEL